METRFVPVKGAGRKKNLLTKAVQQDQQILISPIITWEVLEFKWDLPRFRRRFDLERFICLSCWAYCDLLCGVVGCGGGRVHSWVLLMLDRDFHVTSLLLCDCSFWQRDLTYDPPSQWHFPSSSSSLRVCMRELCGYLFGREGSCGCLFEAGEPFCQSSHNLWSRSGPSRLGFLNRHSGHSGCNFGITFFLDICNVV